MAPDAGAGLHGGHAVNRHGDVDDDAVALADALGLERIGDLADLRQQFAIADLGDGAVVGFEDQGRLVAQASL